MSEKTFEDWFEPLNQPCDSAMTAEAVDGQFFYGRFDEQQRDEHQHGA